MDTYGIVLIYIVGQIMVAATVPLLSYWLARPHLERVAAKAEQVAVAVEEVRIQTNGATEKLEQLARIQGIAIGHAEELANPS